MEKKEGKSILANGKSTMFIKFMLFWADFNVGGLVFPEIWSVAAICFHLMFLSALEGLLRPKTNLSFTSWVLSNTTFGSLIPKVVKGTNAGFDSVVALEIK